MNPQLELVDWLGFFASFALVLTIIGGLFWVLSRLNGRRSLGKAERILAVSEVMSIGTRQRLVLVRARNREILIGVSLQQMTRLGSWPVTAPESEDTAGPAAPATGDWDATITNGAGLKRLLGRISEGK